MMERWEFYDLLIERMESLYGKDIPEIVIKRYVREKNYLQLSEFQNEFRVFGELLMELRQNQIIYSMIGTASHSFLLYLLLQSEMNPLPPHYYCPQCKKILFIEGDEEISMGIDLPRIRCECGCELRGDGFDLSERFFWEREELDLKFSVGKKDYDFVKAWLSKSEYLQDKEIEEEDCDDESIVKKYSRGIITVLAEKTEFLTRNEIGWDEVRKHKEKVIENYEILLPYNKKIKNNPRSLYEVIRVAAFFNTMYMKNTEHYVREDDILDAEDMYLLLEKFYDNDINKVPVFQEDGLTMGEWNVEEYNFLILFTRAFAEYVLDEINDKMITFFDEEEINVLYDFDNKLDEATDEYIFMRKSLEKAETIFIRGEEYIALKLARQICEHPYIEVTQKMLNEVLTRYNDSEIECKDVILLSIDMSISKELLREMREKIGQEKLRWIIIGKSRTPNGVGKMAVIEIRPEKRCSISRKEGIELEMLGPNCTALTRLGLKYIWSDRT